MASSGLIRCGNLSLPNELALLVIDHLRDHNKTLCSLARTCRAMQGLAEEHLYKTIQLLSVKDLHAIIAAFTYRHERVRAVQTLKILYQYKEEDLKGSDDLRTTFNECVPHMVNLREWHIESPFDNNNWGKDGGAEWVAGDMERFRSALEVASVKGPEEANLIAAEHKLGRDMQRTVGLALLESLTIHSHGTDTDFWALDRFHCLFRHPALRYLHVSCIAFPHNEIPELASHVKKTPLTTLIFDECELEPKSLLSILRTPARLKNLTLGENVFNINRSRGVKALLTKNLDASLQALSAVAHSLESLTHYDPGWRRDFSPHVLRSTRPSGDGMRNFHSLKYMQCDTNSFFHQAIIMNRDLAPPSLETLRIHRNWRVPIDFWDQPPDFDHYAALPSLSTLELMQSSYIWLDLSEAEYICEAERLRNRHAKAYKLSKAGINLKMLIELHKSPNLIPPYLHDERVPVVGCVYDASATGFHRHISNSVDDETAVASPDPVQEAPETDQLGDSDIRRLTIETRRALKALKQKFVRPRRDQTIFDFMEDDFSDTDDESLGDVDDDEFEIEDLDEDEDMELELELDGDDDDGFDDDDPIIYQHNGHYYIEVYETDSDDDEMHDAVEEQQDGGSGSHTGGPSANN